MSSGNNVSTMSPRLKNSGSGSGGRQPRNRPVAQIGAAANLRKRLLAMIAPAEADASPPEGRNHHGHHDDPKRADQEPPHALGPGAGRYSRIGPALGLSA